MYLEVKVQDNNHLPITGLEQSVLNVIVQNIHLISSNRREAETWANDKVTNCQVILGQAKDSASLCSAQFNKSRGSRTIKFALCVSVL